MRTEAVLRLAGTPVADRLCMNTVQRTGRHKLPDGIDVEVVANRGVDVWTSLVEPVLEQHNVYPRTGVESALVGCGEVAIAVEANSRTVVAAARWTGRWEGSWTWVFCGGRIHAIVHSASRHRAEINSGGRLIALVLRKSRRCLLQGPGGIRSHGKDSNNE
jgi:hypothetical protein